MYHPQPDRLKFACLFAVLAAVPAAVPAKAAITDPVRTDKGMVSSVPGRDPSVRVFKGIPFAAPPTGANRWKPPQPAADWGGVRSGDQFSSTCLNVTAPGGGRGGKGGGKGGAKGGGNAKGGAPAGPGASEDCLYLNVWTTAASANEKRPVMVWHYGGGFTGGSGSEPRYDGEELAKKGIVVVTYNYRLGMLGFFAHPELSKESDHKSSGNYGMGDALAAMRWVKQNIARFGGDPNKVTIAGESAGGMMVAALVGSPEGKGLFQRAISHSAGYMGLAIGKMRTREQAEEAGAKAAGSNSLADLRAMSTQELGENLRGIQAGVIVDGWLVNEEPTATFMNGKNNKVDLMVGSNADEGTFFGGGNVTADAATSQANQRYGSMAPDFLKIYPAASNEEASKSGLMRTRDELAWHMRTWAQANVKTGKKAYVYYFTRVAPGQEARGATHTAELAYMFNNPPANNQWTDLDHQLADQMTTYWANFIATGDPNSKGLPSWQAYDPKKNDGQAMVFGNSTGFGPQLEPVRIAFFDKFYATQR